MFIGILGLAEVDKDWLFMGLVVAQEQLESDSATAAFQLLYSQRGFNESVSPSGQLPSGKACSHL